MTDQMEVDLPALESIPEPLSVGTNIQSVNHLASAQSVHQHVKDEPQNDRPTQQLTGLSHHEVSIKPETTSVKEQSVKDEDAQPNELIRHRIIPPSSCQATDQSINQDDDVRELVVVADSSSDDDMPILSHINTNNQSNNHSNNQSNVRSSDLSDHQYVNDIDVDMLLSTNEPSTYITPFMSFDSPPSSDQFNQQYQLTLASSGRSSCRICRELIQKGYPRYGINQLKRRHMSTKWFHPACFLTRYLPKLSFSADELSTIREKRGMVADLSIYTRALDQLNTVSERSWAAIKERYDERESQKAAWLASIDPEELEEIKRKKEERRLANAAKRAKKERRAKLKEQKRLLREKERLKKERKKMKKEDTKRLKKEKENDELIDRKLNGKSRVKKESGAIKGEALSELIDHIDRGGVAAVKTEPNSSTQVKRETKAKRSIKVKREVQTERDMSSSQTKRKRKRSNSCKSGDEAHQSDQSAGYQTDQVVKRPRTRSMTRASM